MAQTRTGRLRGDASRAKFSFGRPYGLPESEQVAELAQARADLERWLVERAEAAEPDPPKVHVRCSGASGVRIGPCVLDREPPGAKPGMRTIASAAYFEGKLSKPAELAELVLERPENGNPDRLTPALVADLVVRGRLEILPTAADWKNAQKEHGSLVHSCRETYARADEFARQSRGG